MTGSRPCAVLGHNHRMTPQRDRFAGEILGVGTTEGTRVVVGHWVASPYGPFTDLMIERRDGNRILLAPTPQVAEFVSSTYTFDEVRLAQIDVSRRDGRLDVVGGPLRLHAVVGKRTRIGWALQLLPDTMTAQSWFCRISDPIARILLPGVRTHGTAGHDRYEFYGAHDVHAVTSVSGSWDGEDLGGLAAVIPAPRFGFASTPRSPALTRITTTVVHAP